MLIPKENISDWKTLRSLNYAKLFKTKGFSKHKVFIRVITSAMWICFITKIIQIRASEIYFKVEGPENIEK